MSEAKITPIPIIAPEWPLELKRIEDIRSPVRMVTRAEMAAEYPARPQNEGDV